MVGWPATHHSRTAEADLTGEEDRSWGGVITAAIRWCSRHQSPFIMVVVVVVAHVLVVVWQQPKWWLDARKGRLRATEDRMWIIAASVYVCVGQLGVGGQHQQGLLQAVL